MPFEISTTRKGPGKDLESVQVEKRGLNIKLILPDHEK